jgi:hypothetical protein
VSGLHSRFFLFFLFFPPLGVVFFFEMTMVTPYGTQDDIRTQAEDTDTVVVDITDRDEDDDEDEEEVQDDGDHGDSEASDSHDDDDDDESRDPGVFHEKNFSLCIKLAMAEGRQKRYLFESEQGTPLRGRWDISKFRAEFLAARYVVTLCVAAKINGRELDAVPFLKTYKLLEGLLLPLLAVTENEPERVAIASMVSIETYVGNDDDRNPHPNKYLARLWISSLITESLYVLGLRCYDFCLRPTAQQLYYLRVADRDDKYASLFEPGWSDMSPVVYEDSDAKLAAYLEGKKCMSGMDKRFLLMCDVVPILADRA